jgi:hypothetical protein
MMFTTVDLRRSLLQDLSDLREGKITPHHARSRALVARTIIETIKVEIDLASLKLASLAPVILQEEAEEPRRLAEAA